jgi:SNF2 family DNA or RNA helicase
MYRMGKGGILADDMGLGKTMQCSAFLAGALAASRSSSSFLSANPAAAAAAAAAAGGSKAAAAAAAPVPVRALIVAPKTLLAHWEKELRVCGMGRAAHSFYGSSEGGRSAVLTTITR